MFAATFFGQRYFAETYFGTGAEFVPPAVTARAPGVAGPAVGAVVHAVTRTPFGEER